VAARDALRRTKNNDCHIDGAEDPQLISLLEETILALRKEGRRGGKG